jgi:protein-tyrosine phosphatase
MIDLVTRMGIANHFDIDSAGTAAHHVGERADHRSRQTANERGIDLPSVARQFAQDDFRRFDFVLAMDTENYENLLRMAQSPSESDKLHLFRSFDPNSRPGASVPDPYYGGAGGFDTVFDICDAACRGLLSHLQETHSILR